MTQLELDYIFVSQRGLRDGLMIDLLHKHYAHAAPGQQDAEHAESLEQIGQKYNFHAAHGRQVTQLALSIFYQLQKLHQLDEKHAGILRAAAMLHDIGSFIAFPKHHKHSYYLIKSSRPSSFNKEDVDLIANVARYHRKAHPTPKHLGFSQLSPSNQDVVRKLSAIPRSGWTRLQGTKCSRSEVRAVGTQEPLHRSHRIRKTERRNRARVGKRRLMEEVFNVKLSIRQAKESVQTK
jgi:exopolyphosphatase/pppGpp-phosphohydrolase